MKTNAELLNEYMKYWCQSRSQKVKYLGDWLKSLTAVELQSLIEAMFKVEQARATDIDYTKIIAFLFVVYTTEMPIPETQLTEEVICRKINYLSNALKIEVLKRSDIIKHHPKIRLLKENIGPRGIKVIKKYPIKSFDLRTP